MPVVEPDAPGAEDSVMLNRSCVSHRFVVTSSLRQLLKVEARSASGDATEAAIRQNVRRVVTNLRERSDPLLMEPQAQGKLKVVGAYYELGTGRVDFFDMPR